MVDVELERQSAVREAPPARPVVRRFREILLWPLQLERVVEDRQVQKHWEILAHEPGGEAWHEVEDEFTGDATQFQERHYAEFVTFLPPVQRFLYGEGPCRAVHSKPVESSLRVFRRDDIRKLRVTPVEGGPSYTLDIAHIDLYFFYDVDVTILAVEVIGADLPFEVAQDILFRFGRAYPPSWESAARASTCAHNVEWLDAHGEVLAASDMCDRSRFLEFVCEHRAPRIAAHWAFVMRPLVLHASDDPGRLRYRQLEYYRMPAMAYLAMDDMARLTRNDYVRLALLTGPGNPDVMPFSDYYLRDFERRFCYDRHFDVLGNADVNATRTLTCGHDFVTVGNDASAFFVDPETGFLAQFRHQYFLLFLIAHLHKACLLMLSNRLAAAIQELDIQDGDSVRRFKRTIRQSQEVFLRFTHRYWFHEVSIQGQAREIFALVADHLGNDALYTEVRDETMDMMQYLDSDNVRRQANVVVRLTVITTVGLVGTTATGFLGMNLIAAAESPLAVKLGYFMAVFVPTALLLVYTVVKSKRLSDFFEVLSDERAPMRRKWQSLAHVWAKRG
ncbi:MAG TPA: hypothetical protein VFJ62_05980 [Usitatibacter sp.]|nr:hypothetical protein [Usitatibacter sp.]